MKAEAKRNMAHSVHQRLLNVARGTMRPFNELLQHYAIERFLYRIGRSKHAEKLLLKGALLLRVWNVPMARPTMDIDLLGRVTGTQDELAVILKDCMQIEVEDDGLVYLPDTLRIEAITKEADYQGTRMRFTAKLGNARVQVQVDVGVGDIVYPRPVWIDFPTILGNESPHLLAYTPESAIAEKFQAMVALGMANSRMKDYHDIWMLANTLEFDGKIFSEAIRRTFDRRETRLPELTPPALNEKFHSDETKRTQWSAFIRGLKLKDALALENVVVLAAQMLMPPSIVMSANKPFEMKWNPGGPWK
ncbi:MAG: nucleotidyl transferase AbiEii/AbiGii toxin family protein [Pseudomonadota bacterium]